MKKIILSTLLLVAMICNIVALTACDLFGGGATDFNELSSEAVVYDGSEVKITFSHTMGAELRTVLDEAIAEFNKLYPKITIEHNQVGSYDDVLSAIKTELTAGNQPNIAYCYSDHVASYNIAGAVLTLDNFIASKETVTRADGSTEILGLTDEQKADFIKGYYDEGASYGDGLMYTLPMSKSTEVLYYNKTFFDQNNLTVPKTWEEMEALCAKIKEIDPTCIPLGYDSEANWFITMCEQYGAPYTSASGDEHFLFNNETARNFTDMIRGWYQKGYVTTQELYGGYTSDLFIATSGKKCYMCIGSSAGAKNQKPKQDSAGNYLFEADIAPIPQKDPANPKVISQGPSLCIFKDENPQEVAASWLFVKYLTTDLMFQASFSSVSGYVPVIKSVNNDENYAKYLNDANGTSGLTALSVKKCLEQEKSYFTSPAFNGSSEARDQVGALLQTVMLMQDSDDVKQKIEAAFKEAVEKCNYNSGY